VYIEQLSAGDGARLRAIRLRALQDSPQAFETTFEEAAARPLDDWDGHLEQIATFVAVAGGRDVGLVRGMRHQQFPDAGYLISMWVAPEARQQGTGSALVGAVIQWGRAQGLDRLLLDVGEMNATAIALYTRKGFLPTGETGSLPPPRDHVREIQMAMKL
jgi:GNAT superfamily N-acetyltransferase